MVIKFRVTELSVCTVCAHLLSNGEYDDGTDVAESAAAGIARTWGDDARHLVPGGEELGFRTSPCGTCGDDLHGDRFTASLLMPIAAAECDQCGLPVKRTESGHVAILGSGYTYPHTDVTCADWARTRQRMGSR